MNFVGYNHLDCEIHDYSNGLLEGLNSMIQPIKANSRGYRNDDNFMMMIFLRQVNLKLDLPT